MVLAGGRSRRMGEDKAWVEIGGRPLIERVLDVVATLSDDVMVVGAEGPRYAELAVRLVADAVPGQGSLIGIYSGLRAARYERSLCVACDMPFLNPRLLAHMIEISPDYDAVVPYLDPEPPPPGTEWDAARTHLLHPLCAVYSHMCLPAIERALQDGDLRAIAFFNQVRVRYLTLPEVDQHDPEHHSFLNVNTPAELVAARKLLESEVG
jgi:molybdopterin-guanine dinucleotide biosynthesis protein A